MNSPTMRYRFFFHLNKPLTKATGDVWWTIHCRGRCYSVKSIRCEPPTETKSNKSQPLGVVRGYCRYVEIIGDAANVI